MNVHLVLTRTEYPANIGAAARALANMGGGRLILIAPIADRMDESSRRAAAGAQEWLRNSVVHADWDEFHAREPDGLRVALTRRGGRKRRVFPLKQTLDGLQDDLPNHLYLIMGPEADGLRSEDLALINFTCHLPVHGEFGSLNLAQAALLALHIARERFPADATPRQVNGETPEVALPFYFPDDLIKEWLTEMGFDIRARKASAYLTLRRLFLQNRPSRHEVQVLESVLRQNVRKLKERSVALAPEQLADHRGDVAGENI
ncbi:MAG TPA: TrmH family RNA methyltransferase [Bdellovibrionales bacterium]|nr:TrmH family RNA methyltransferase [Bdellovibrionales bacterium]